MATTRLPYERVASGALPPVCIRSGGPADGLVEARFGRLPPWTFLLLLAGILPFVVAVWFGQETVRAQVPVQRQVMERYHRMGRRAVVGWGVAGLAGVAAAAGLSWLWLAAAAGVGLVAASWFQRAIGWVDGELVRGTSLVELRRVSSEFAAAVDADESARPHEARHR